MQPFSGDVKIFKDNYICNKKMPSKAAYFTAQSEIFSNANRPKTSPHLIFCSIKMAHRGTYINLYIDFNIKWTPLNYSLCNLPSIIVSVQFLTHEFLKHLDPWFILRYRERVFWSERTYRLPGQVSWLTGRQAGRLSGWRLHCMYTQQGGRWRKYT